MTTIGNYKYISSYNNSNPTIPIDNDCCKKTCEMLYDTIKSMEVERDGMEFVKRLRLQRINEKRLEDIRDSFIPTLQNMSYTLTEEGICKCVENVPEKYK